MLKAGTAKTDITPPIGTPMAAFPVKRKPEPVPRKAEGFHDRLHARALALSDGSTDVIICSTDLCAIRTIVLERIRKQVCEKLPCLKPEQILVNVSHTHSGPEVSFLHGGNPDMEFVAVIEKQLADTVVRAFDDMEPVSIAWGRTLFELNHNRRVLDKDGRAQMHLEYEQGVTDGPDDQELHVFRFDRPDGTLKSLLYHYTAHALTLGPKNMKFSADFPGITSALIEKEFPGCTAQFLNGAAGNIHPHRCMREDTQARDEIGPALAQAVLDTAEQTEIQKKENLFHHIDRIVFENRRDSSLEVPVELHILKLGSFIFGFVPGEFFVEHQLRFKQEISPLPGTLVGYANGWPGYVPTRESYAEGGYGVDLSEDDRPEYCRTSLPAGAGEAIIDRLLELLNDA